MLAASLRCLEEDTKRICTSFTTRSRLKNITLLHAVCGKKSPSLHLSVKISFDASVVADVTVFSIVEESSIVLRVLGGVSIVDDGVVEGAWVEEKVVVEPMVGAVVVVAVEEVD